LTLVSPLFAETLRIALDAADGTEGLVRPTLGGALEAAGYTRDSSMLTPDPAPPATPPQPTGGSVFALGRVVGLEPGVALDLNGVVKRSRSMTRSRSCTATGSYRREATWRRGASSRRAPRAKGPSPSVEGRSRRAAAPSAGGSALGRSNIT
jgi:Membrane-associated lipoprotein involved in thiamine biosynthesis